MDYIFFASLRGINHESLSMFVSYDIACQWSRNFWNRMMHFPHKFRIDSTNVTIVFLVPKFHLPAHHPACHSTFSFNFTPHVSRTDGEVPERGWSNTNALGSSMKEMGPGSRQDTLDDHFGDMNWKKVCDLGLLASDAFTTTILTDISGASLLCKITVAVPEWNEHLYAFHELTKSLPNSTTEWKDDVEAWEKDKTKPNPFEFKGTGIVTCLVDMSNSDPPSQSLAWLPSNLPCFKRKRKRCSKARV
jgi:hypothetical protein